MDNAFNTLLDATIAHLEGERTRGVRQARVSQTALAELVATPRRALGARQDSATGQPPASSRRKPRERTPASAFPSRQEASSQPAPQPPQDQAGTPTAPLLGSASPTDALQALRHRVDGCQQCANLASSRTKTVFGVGNPEAELMFVGEAPGADEDRQGEPFVGLAGQLLDRIISAMGLSRQEVYIGNVLKCRPDMPTGSHGNRKPTPSEMVTCLPYLEEQIGIIQPKVLVALGLTAVEGLLGKQAANAPMSRLRGRWLEFRGTPLMATYHPAYLLRNQALSEKRKVWEDMLLVMERLGLPISERQRGFFLKAMGR